MTTPTIVHRNYNDNSNHIHNHDEYYEYDPLNALVSSVDALWGDDIYVQARQCQARRLLLSIFRLASFQYMCCVMFYLI